VHHHVGRASLSEQAATVRGRCYCSVGWRDKRQHEEAK